MANRYGSFAGGYRFKRFAGQPEASLAEAGLPARTAVPLRSRFGTDLAPLVKTGEKVRAGQVIARDDKTGASLAAPVGGTVEELKPAAWLGGKTKVAAVASDGSAEWVPLSGHAPDWKALKGDTLRDLVRRAGAGELPAEASHLVVQAVEADAYSPNPAVLLEAWGQEAFLEGLAILARALPGARLHLALSQPRRALLERLATAARQAGLDLEPRALSRKYPQAHPVALSAAIFGKEQPGGVLVLDLQTVFHVRDAVVLGKPLIERVVALAGPGFRRRPHVRVRVGTPVGSLLESYLEPNRKSQIVINSLLGGRAVADPAEPVGADASVLIALPENAEGGFLSFATPGFTSDSFALAFAANILPLARRCDTNLHGEHRACISCGFCESVCPVRILPNILHRYVQRNVIDETLVRFQIFRCIDCNLCSYVCTSKIPLGRLLREGKEKLRREGLGPREASS
jgi:electron transport complex protein RnfC